MKHFKLNIFIISGILALIGTNPVLGQNDQADQVSRTEYESLKSDFDAMKLQLEKLTSRPNRISNSDAEANTFAIQRAEQRLLLVEEFMSQAEDGDSGFHVTGYAFTTYNDTQNAQSDFSTVFAPIILWELSDRILFESELEFSLSRNEEGEGSTEVELEYAHGSYIVNDHITVGAGKFLTPFGVFGERLHPAWINKLPVAPMAYAHHGGLVPMTSLGAYVRGGIPIGDFKANYAFYVSNGPTLVTSPHHGVGTLDFTNFNDLNSNKGIGGRVGLLPIPEIEIGYSFLFAEVDADSFGQDIDALVQGIDVSYVADSESLGGLFDFRFEMVFSDVDDVHYAAAEEDGHGDEHGDEESEEEEHEEDPFDNKRSGGYVQLAYRPIYSDFEFMRNLEFVGRYGWLEQPGGESGAFDSDRWTFGVNYWFDHSSVLKLSYQRTNPVGSADTSAFMAQVAFGF